jgi:hypothetical protein
MILAPAVLDSWRCLSPRCEVGGVGVPRREGGMVLLVLK